ncbi:metallophosphoesterase family protein [Rubrobacter indicoceani]|uniref:metallophosphoesterase family protein n=1 Tax=Rubrobacter indicoceani TaxID=2051957 RepID=UPI0013C51DBC|nr:DNA repair exonuclease [Rubrobacter indicoceani]
MAHISDTHLGYARYSKLEPTSNRNQREVDVAEAYKRAVDAILEAEVDLVIHSGDVFDTIRPATHVVLHFLRQTQRITRENIPYLGIAGNHETPRLRATTASLMYAHLVRATFACGFEPESGVVPVGDAQVGVSLVPHGAVLDRELVVMPEPGADLNLLVTHGTVPGLTVKGHELGEIDLPSHLISQHFDYIALGHYHFFHAHGTNAHYAGATERFGFGEVNSEPGFALLTFDESGGTPEVEHIPVRARPMIDLRRIDASDMDASELTEAILHHAGAADLDGAIVRQRVAEVPVGVAGGVDRATLRDLKRRCLDYSLEFTEVGASETPDPGDAGANFGSLQEEFKAFVGGKRERGDLSPAFAADFLRRGTEYLNRAGTGEEVGP